MSSPRISIIIPTYNRREIVPRAVASALAQTDGDLEVVVVDDGSTDGTLDDLAERFDDPRLVCVRQENGGTASARNLGLRRARGSYVAFLDSDDWQAPDFAERQLAALEAAPWAELALADIRYVGRADGRWDRANDRCSPPTSLEDMLMGRWALVIGWLVRMRTARELAFSESSYVEDTDFLFRFFAAGHRSVLVPEVLATYDLDDSALKTPRKCRSTPRVRKECILLRERFGDLANDPDRHRLRMARCWTRYFVKAGRPREARPYALRWWLGRPFSPHAIQYGLRSFMARGRGGGSAG